MTDQHAECDNLRIALKLLRSWALGENYHAAVMITVRNWIDAGMRGAIPWLDGQFFALWAADAGLVNVDGFVRYARKDFVR